MIPYEFIKRTDELLISRGYPLNIRPLHVITKWMNESGISGDPLDDAIWQPLMVIYSELYPSGDFSSPPMQIGAVGFRDQAYIVNVILGYGTFRISLRQCIDADDAILDFIYQNYIDQFWEAHYVVMDLWDFAYGIADLRHKTQDPFFDNASASLAGAATSLRSPIFDYLSALQSIHLAAELSLKGALRLLGEPITAVTEMRHDLEALCSKLNELKPSDANTQLLTAASLIPNYVKTRYKRNSHTKVDLLKFCHLSQFICGEAARRVSNRNIAKQLSGPLPPRKLFTPA